MRNIPYVILIVFTIISCKKDNVKTTRSHQNDEIQKHEPIFLGLSPKMSNESYDKEIKKLNSEGTLTENEFPLIIDNEEFYFKIQKKDNYILLYYVESTSIENSMNDNIVHQKCLKYNKLNEKRSKKSLHNLKKNIH